jgi:hypothetical protein
LDARQFHRSRAGQRARRRAELCQPAVRLCRFRTRPAGLGDRNALARPAASHASITTFEPLTNTSYIPCVSLLDFWLRSGRLELVVYAHSIDFGKKGYGNLVQLAELQSHVAARLGKPVGRLTMIVKSAHIYETEFVLMGEVLEAASDRRKAAV